MITINRSTFDEDNARKTILFTFSFPVILTFDLLSSLDLSYLVTVVQCYVFTKLDVSTAFLFKKIGSKWSDGQTDGRTACNA